MKMKAQLFLISLVVFSLFLFNYDGIEEQTEYEVQDSELALLMRKIHIDAKLMRTEIKEGKVALIYDPSIEFIVSATPTKPNVQGQEYDAFARYYIQKVQDLVETNSEEDYNKMVESCVACHQEFCPGPIKTIKKLNFPISSIAQ